MDGIHDLGGMHGFGPVPIKTGDYVFKYDWQRRAFGVTQALAGPVPFCADMHRHKIERMPAVDYLQMDYFEKWVVANSELLKDAGLVNDAELKSGKKEFDVDLAKHAPVDATVLVNAFKAGVELKFPDEVSKARFAAGDTVRVLSNSPAGHTRAPRYVRGRIGKIVSDLGVFQFADTVSAGQGPHPQHYYTVVFSAETLWGKDAETPNDHVYLDLAEAYIEHARHG